MLDRNDLYSITPESPPPTVPAKRRQPPSSNLRSKRSRPEVPAPVGGEDQSAAPYRTRSRTKAQAAPAAPAAPPATPRRKRTGPSIPRKNTKVQNQTALITSLIEANQRLPPEVRSGEDIPVIHSQQLKALRKGVRGPVSDLPF